MSEIKSLAAPKASFDRRSVVKGAAWSVPVIAAAIAAPAAAASHTGTPTLAFNTAAGQSYIGEGTRTGSAPQGIIIKSVGAVTGGITVLIQITAKSPALKTPAVQVSAITPATGVGSFSPTYVGNYNSSTSFTYTGGMAHDSFHNFGFSYSHNGRKNEAVGGNYDIKVTVTFPNSTPLVQSTTLTLI